jgi:aminodeoxyfutalosine synthase
MTLTVHSSLQGLNEKVESGAVWSRADGLQLLASFDVIDIGRLAEAARVRLLGNVTTVVEAASLRLEELASLADRGAELGANHGLLLLRDPKGWIYDQPYAAYLEAIRSLAARLPVGTTLAIYSTDTVKALAKQGERDLAATLTDLWTAGIRLIAGGEELAVHEAAHMVGLRTVVDLPTMADRDSSGPGPSTPEEAFVDALLAVRDLQAKTEGFVAARVALPARLSGVPDAKQIACARLLLQNIPHLSLGWGALMLKAAQVLMHFGIDDLGPIQSAKADLTEMAFQIRQTGRQPLLRNGLFETIREL